LDRPVQIDFGSTMLEVPPTERGRASRERIVQAAARLVAKQGAAATSLDDVMKATHASKSQLYHYFGDRHGLVQAVVEYESAAVLGLQARALASVATWEDLDAWADGMVAMLERRRSRGGCPIGTLAAAMADTDETLRQALSEAFETWREAISGALRRLRDGGLLASDADLDTLSTIMLAAIQGGLLLAKTTRDSTQLGTALDGAMTTLRSYAATPRKPGRGGSHTKAPRRPPRGRK
jgi:TetR/AcrR family transcriptional regulator, transcriptional repressor for nem operon